MSVTSGKTLRAGAVQFQHTPGDKAANLAVMQQFVQEAARRQIQLLLFPECCICGYWHLRRLERPALLHLAERVPDGPSARQLCDWSAAHDMTICAGLLERDDDGRLYNAAVVAMPDGRCVSHRKLHAFVSEHLTSGDRFTVFDTPHDWRMAVLICYDNNIIENVRACALAGAEVLLAPHQTGGCRSGSPHAMGPIDVALWERRHEDPQAIEAEFSGDKGRGWLMRWLPARAHDNGMFVVFANGVGRDDDEVRTGNAMILDPYGRILAETTRADNALVVAELASGLRDRCTGVRWITARRPELYGTLTIPTGRERPTRLVRFDHE